jgi:xanthine/uracil/vitamin C permease (AzgA family)
MGVGPGPGLAAAFGVALAPGAAVPWPNKLAAIVISVNKARNNLGT